ncbi:DEAD/DEAH box helicase [bacterium]|nr:DEAD/DEAH box helicase [candidate division CSSED10-310 bacterium]
MQHLIEQLIDKSGWRRDRCITRILSGQTAIYSDQFTGFSDVTRHLLENAGIKKLYSHQAKAIASIRAGHDVLLATPTASGKSLTYQIPILEEIIRDPATSAILLFPFKALARDQDRIFREDLVAGDFNLSQGRPLSGIYDGDTKTSDRKQIRLHPPHVLITNPDMLHYGFLPYHTRWNNFLSNVKYVVVDEIHVYRGVFGSQVLQTMRRFLRVLKHYGADPRIIACSATIGNPGELARNLLQRQFDVISTSGAPLEPKAFISHFPDDKASTAAVHMLEACIQTGLKTIVFTKSRRSTELIYRYMTERNPHLNHRLGVYRAGFLPEQRREIEKKLFNNELSGVISTSALELGINIGGLDCCILVGFPGSVSSLWQRAGRVGRRQQPSLVIYIAGEDALDRYWFEHEDILHQSPVERAVVYENNDEITDMHLECAADELILDPGTNYPDSPHIRERIAYLTETNRLLECAGGNRYVCRESSPQRRISIRSIGDSYEIRHVDRGVIGHVDGVRVFKECHPGSIYLHSGEVFRVDELDQANFRVIVSSGPEDVYTQSVTSKETDILSVDGRLELPGLVVNNGRLRVREKVTGYSIRRIFSGEIVSRHDLDLPELVFETRGLWMNFSEATMDAVKSEGLHPMGGLHALEHAMIGLYPLISICDRSDLAGISTQSHHQTGGAAVFIYDSFPGGLGLAESALPQFDNLLRETLRHVSTCPCNSGCPYCIQSPKCGSGNEPLDKRATVFLMEAGSGLRSIESLQIAPAISDNPPSGQQGELFINRSHGKTYEEVSVNQAFVIPPLPDESDCPEHTELVFDIETQLSAEEVGGWDKADKMRIAICVVFDISLNRYEFYLEKDAPRLIQRLARAERIVGYNSDRFDLTVLKGYADKHVINRFPSLDLIHEITRGLGFRTGLDKVSSATVGARKTADGLQSLKWWRENRIDLIASYCQKDVEVTNLVYQFGKSNGYVMHAHRSGEIIRVPVNW